MPKKTLYAELILCDAPASGISAPNQLGLIRDATSGVVTGIKIGDGATDWSELNSIYYTKNEINQLVKGSGSVFFNTPSEMIKELSSAKPTDYVRGQAIFLINNEFPDVWITTVESNRVDYTGTIENLQATLIAGTTVQIGYFKIQTLQGNLHVEIVKKLDKNGLEWDKDKNILEYINPSGAIQILGTKPTDNRGRPKIKMSIGGFVIENNSKVNTKDTGLMTRNSLKFAQYTGSNLTTLSKQITYATDQIIFQPSATVKNVLMLPSDSDTSSSSTSKDGITTYTSTLATQNWTNTQIDAIQAPIIEQILNKVKVKGRFCSSSTMAHGVTIPNGLAGGWGKVYMYTGEGLELKYNDGKYTDVIATDKTPIGSDSAKILIIILPQNYYSDGGVDTYRCKAIWSSDSLTSAKIKDFTLKRELDRLLDLGQRSFKVIGTSGASEWVF